jgi:hypothetical protein
MYTDAAHKGQTSRALIAQLSTYDKLVQGWLDSIEGIVITTGAPLCVREGFLHLCLEGGKVGLYRGNGGTGDKVADVLCEGRVTIDKGVDKVYQLCIG